MTINTYGLLVFAHVVLFAYWIGADLGVFILGYFAAKTDRPYEERMRLRYILYQIDLAPRIALVLILAVSFHLSSYWGTELSTLSIASFWVFCLAWLGLVLALHFAKPSPMLDFIRRFDLAIRYGAVAVLSAIAIYSLVNGAPVTVPRLNYKILALAAIIVCGILLRVFVKETMRAYKLLGDGDSAAEAIIQRQRKRSIATVLTLWGLVLLAAFLGTVQPF